MSLSGNLNEFSVLETLQLIGLQKKTGRLEVESGRRRCTLQFHDGALLGCAAERDDEADPLLDALVALGLCELRQARAWRSSGAHLDGEALRERSGLDPEEYEGLRRTILQGTVDQVLLWDHGTFRFTPDPPALSRVTPLNLEEILLESMRRLDEAAELRHGGLPPEAVPHAAAQLRPGQLEELEPAQRWIAAAVLRRCTGRRPVKRLATDLGLAEYELLTALTSLRQRGLVRVVTRGRGEAGAEPLLDHQPRRLPNPAAPIYAAAILAIALGSGWAVRAITHGQIEPANRAAQAERAGFESERAVRHALEIFALRHGRYPAALSELAGEALWPESGSDALEAFDYRPAPEGSGFELTARPAARIHDAATARSSTTASES